MQGLTFEARYALVALVSLARNATGHVKQMREISSEEGLPAPFLSKILLKLRHAGLVISRHGRGGGYALGRPPQDISVRDVMTTFADSAPLAFDLRLPSVAATASVALGLKQLNDRVQAVLAETSVADLAGFGRATAPAPGVEHAIAV